MSPNLPSLVCTILNALLDRYEQPQRQTVVRMRLNERDHAMYFSADSAAPRRDANIVLQRLASQNFVQLRWRKHEVGNWLEAVDLVPEHVAALYSLLNRTPRTVQHAALHELLLFQPAHTGWHADFLKWVRTQLDQHRSVAPLTLDDERWNRDLLRALATLATLTTPTLERTLSVRLFGNSKRLHELRSAIVTVLRRHNPAASAYADDLDALLRSHNLDRVPEYVPLAGLLVLQLGEDRSEASTDFRADVVDLAPFVPSVALSAAMLRHATVIRCAGLVVSVENATSFSELLMLRPPTVLAIYTGGFASPTVIKLLQQIRAASPDAPFLHWGDLDAGGLRILRHLRSQLGAVQPLAMDVATFHACSAHMQPLTSSDRAALTALRADAVLDDCHTLIDHLLRTGCKLEQGAVPGDVLMDRLHKYL